MRGPGSVPLWNDINGAKTVSQLRVALYHLACRCQSLEAEIEAAMSHADLNHSDDAKSGGSLESHIRSLPIDSLRRNYETQLRDWAETDTAVRLAARRVLSEAEVEGDSFVVPSIEDIVELLVAIMVARRSSED